ncbi:hypothetical protein EVAR_92656_1 [Eumeta japonica]|uniref:Uncharacterized protein n=1 Tax=Eumeta variegata TaxID=151549 RepID=A0A4C1T0C8_EUMVA|nr:hypothetical protein EVAR_92656_1 [Eumeta japonica]
MASQTTLIASPSAAGRQRVPTARDMRYGRCLEESSRHRMSQETVTGRFPSLLPGEALVNGPLEGGNQLLLFLFHKEARYRPRITRVGRQTDDGRGTFCLARWREGGALRNSCSDKTSCRTCVPYPIEGLGYIKDSYGATFGFKASETYSTKRRTCCGQEWAGRKPNCSSMIRPFPRR